MSLQNKADDDVFRAALDAAREELERVRDERSDALELVKRAEKRIAALSGTVAGLETILDEPEGDADGLEALGFTEACRAILAAEPDRKFRATEIRDALIARKVDLSKYSHPISAIHTVMNRLVKAKDVYKTMEEKGTPLYEWMVPF